MARKMVVTATGKSYTATTTPATVQIPFNSADMWPSLLTVSATAPVHIKLGDPSVSATTADLMVQPADHVTIRTNGAGYISYRSASGTCNVQISPTEDGPMNYRGNIPDYIQGILAPYGSNAHVYLPGASGATVAGFQTGNYTSNDGSTGLSAIDGTCGLALDAAGAVGAELAPAIDGTWTRDASVSLSGSTFVFASTPINTNGAYKAIALSVGVTYQVTLTLSAYTSGQFAVWLGAQESSTVHTPLAAAGSATFFLTPTGAYNGNLIIGTGPTGTGSATVSALSIKPVTGIHASQSSGAARPGVRRGLYNLLSYSNDLSNAAWTKTATSITGTGEQKIVESAASATHYVPHASITITSGQAYTYLVALRAGERGFASVQADANGGFLGGVCTFNLSAGSLINQGGSATATIAPYGSGYLIAISATATGATANPGVGIRATSGSGFETYLGDGTSGIYHNGSALVAGVITAAQAISEGGIPLTTSAAASNQSAGRYSWQFDGSNDSLALGSVPFQMSDDHCVIASYSPVAAGLTTAVFDARSTASNNPIVAKLGLGAGVLTAQWRDDAATLVTINGSTPSVGQMSVASAVKRGNNKYLRVNGAQAGTDATVLGATTPTNAAIGYSPTAATANFHSGSTGPIILIKGTVSDADLLTLERWVASQTPNGPSF